MRAAKCKVCTLFPRSLGCKGLKLCYKDPYTCLKALDFLTASDIKSSVKAKPSPGSLLELFNVIKCTIALAYNPVFGQMSCNSF